MPNMKQKKTKKTKQENGIQKIILFWNTYHVWILLGLVFVFYIFLRFYQLQERASWGWDQVDVAWNAQKILINHEHPLLGMPAKANTGFNIGPAYYYIAAVFYFLANLNPIASPLLASTVSLLTFFTIFYVTKKLFTAPMALIAVAIYTFSLYAINFDRVQWPVNFIVPISYLIFFALYKIITGSPKYFFLLSFLLGFSLHIHFTSVFYFVIFLCCLPLLPRKKETLLYMILSAPLFLIWLVPFVIVFSKGSSVGSSMANYLHGSYHGVHLRRILQEVHDGFIEFQGIIFYPFAQYISFLFLPLFLGIYLYRERPFAKLVLSYLTILWFVVPWFAFSTYKGEISNYYFSMTRPIAVMILAYLTYKSIIYRWYVGGLVAIFWVVFIFSNLQIFFRKPENEFADRIKTAHEKIKSNDPVAMYQNFPESYWQWYLEDYKKEVQ